MNPVHSSLIPFFDAPGHFHAIELPQKIIHYQFNVVEREVNDASIASCRMNRLNEGAGSAATHSSELLHQPVVEAHQLRLVVILQHQLSWAHFRFLAQQNFRSKMPLQFVE